MSQQERDFSKAVESSKAYEKLLIRLITLECNQGIHTETYNNTKFPNPENKDYCMNCGAEVE